MLIVSLTPELTSFYVKVSNSDKRLVEHPPKIPSDFTIHPSENISYLISNIS